MNIKVIFLLGIAFTVVKSSPIDNNYTVGCVKCHAIDPTKINVHLIPHSHDDVGWLKTVDQYYYGMNSSIQQAGVQYIITSVLEALLDNKNRRFIQVETQFLWKWWKEQRAETLAKYRSLLDNGQIEIVNGAWTMNDEACTNYQSTIDQFTWGLKTLSETLGGCGRPRVGWQIDPFGHSREQASILAQLGFDGIMFARLDHDDKKNRMKKKALDFAWKGSANLDDSVIFGSIFPTDLYFPPNGFCWDYKCTDDAIDDDPNSVDYNIREKVANFTSIVKTYKEYFPTNNVIIPMGGDFQYEAAEVNYENMDRFIKAFANNSEINVIYSTPSCYIRAVNDALTTNLTLKTDDFFPYSNDKNSFWTGYYSSRPNSKRFERTGHNILQATKQLYAQSAYITNKTYDENLRFLRETMGVMQHHDAITGTEKQHVANDYVRRLDRGIKQAEKDMGEIFDKLLNNTLKLNVSSCLLSNVSICPVSQDSNQFVVFVYNPLAWKVTHYVRLPVEEASYEINGNSEPFDLVPVISNFSFIKLPRGTPSTHELVFAARDVPPLGFKIYHIKKTTLDRSQPTVKDINVSSAFKIDPNTNLLQLVELNGKTVNISQNFNYYYSETGEQDKTGIASGAYLFRPAKTEAELFGEVNITYSLSGAVVQEVHQQWFGDGVDILQTIRWYKSEDYLEFDWIVGNINIDKEEKGKEIISRFTVTDEFNNNNTFFTDSNGREMIQRTKNMRPDYSYNASVEPVAGNYYPVSSKIVIKDDKRDVRVAVLTDRSQGGSSLRSNEIELMVHRRLVKDDLKGVGESLNETEFGIGTYVRGSHYLVIGKASDNNQNGKTTVATERILAQKKLAQPWVGLATMNDRTFDDLKMNVSLTYEGLEKSLPENVNILTFEPWNNGDYLLRLEHIMEKNEDGKLSKPVSVDIANAFKHFTIKKMTETTLGANELLSAYQSRAKYIWKTDKPYSTKNEMTYNAGNISDISLEPMQIRTFIVKLDKKEVSPSFGLILKPFTSVVILISLLVVIF